MAIRVAVNGMGRIGRLAVRAGWDNPAIEFVAVNDRRGDAGTHAHLLEFDSVHGRWDQDIAGEGATLHIGGRALAVSQVSDPAALPWSGETVDIVLECTGQHLTPAALRPYLDKGVAKVVVSAPVKDPAVLNLVMAVNDHLYDPATHHLVTAASCTTNCLAPVVKVMHEGIGIAHGAITTIHHVTNTQVIVDAPKSDLRRARSALNSLIPTTTGSATAIGLIYPELAGKLNGHAVRVPLLNASLTDCVFEMARETSAEEINHLFAAAAAGPLKGVLGYETRPLVSADYLNDSRSAIVDGLSTMVVNGRQAKVFAWYDNEWGYTCRMVDLAVKIARAMG
ncbi:MAG: ArsJ-associated glyceraldehyde-3-phosphate dehydrogenase [Thalassobaculaceae bacterium]